MLVARGETADELEASLDESAAVIEKLTAERDGARRGCCFLAVECGEADSEREEAEASGWDYLYPEAGPS